MEIVLTDEQIQGAMVYFEAKNKVDAELKIKSWVLRQLDKWYNDSFDNDIDAISNALRDNPKKIVPVKAVLKI
jgi:hypothetical protein